MSEVYLTLADGFEKLAAGYRALATEGAVVQSEEEVPATASMKETRTRSGSSRI